MCDGKKEKFRVPLVVLSVQKVPNTKKAQVVNCFPIISLPVAVINFIVALTGCEALKVALQLERQIGSCVANKVRLRSLYIVMDIQNKNLGRICCVIG